MTLDEDPPNVRRENLEALILGLIQSNPQIKDEGNRILRAYKSEMKTTCDKQKVYAHYYTRVHRLYSDCVRV